MCSGGSDLELGGGGGVVLHTLSAFLPCTISSFFYPKQREWGGGGGGWPLL